MNKPPICNAAIDNELTQRHKVSFNDDVVERVARADDYGEIPLVLQQLLVI